MRGRVCKIGGLSGYITTLTTRMIGLIKILWCSVSVLDVHRMDRSQKVLERRTDNLNQIIKDLIDWAEEIMGEIDGPRNKELGNQIGNLGDFIKENWPLMVMILHF